MDDIPTELNVRRRRLMIGAAAAASIGLAGVAFRSWRRDPAARTAQHTEADPAHTEIVLLVFLSTLFGHEFDAADRADLSERLTLLLAAPEYGADCRVLAYYLDHLAQCADGKAFQDSSPGVRERVVAEVMDLDFHSPVARAWSRVSAGHRAFVRLRWSAVSQLQWLYRHSSVPWRQRGYTRWPGVGGDWREVLVAGQAYP